MTKITKNTKISEVMASNPQVQEILFQAGMGCVCCPMAMQETIGDGCLAHGMSKEEIDELLKRLNK